MAARVLFIGLDSAESTLVERWTSEGRLPALARLREEGRTYRLESCWGTLPTAVWPELTTGRSPGKVALFFPPAQLRTGEAEPRHVAAADVDPTGFWTVASDAGRRVAAIDLPWTVAPRGLNGIFLGEWGTHDRWFGSECFPETLADELRSSHGDYPVRLCDKDYGGSASERARLGADLVAAVEHETRLLLDLLARERWDLFACAFGQFQCAGHNFWGLMEDGESAPDGLDRVMLDVYAKVDEGIAALREAAGSDALTAVVASHGMGPIVGGPQLLPEVLVRLGAGSGRGTAAGLRSRLPIGLRSAIRRLVPGRVRGRLQEAAGSLPSPLASAATRAVALPADVNGYVRLNLRGREPNGCVAPDEADAELATIRAALLELQDPRSGERIVRTIVSADEAFGPDRNPDVPDLMVSFRDDLGVLDACTSPRVGLVRVPFRVANRTGDHNGRARLWLGGPGIGRAATTGEARSLDVAPTVLSLLGVAPPPELDGRSLLVAGAAR